MTISLRHYAPPDFFRVSDFLVANFQPGNQDGNWLQPAWEYMHTHPALDETSLDKIGIWESSGEIVAVAHYEHQVGEAFFQLHPHFSYLKVQLLDFAEQFLRREVGKGERYLRVYVNEFDRDLEALVRSGGYELAPEYRRSLSELKMPRYLPTIYLPDGYRIKSLAEDNDLHKVNRILWRGFGHSGEPPEEEVPGRAKMQSGPNYRKDLAIVVEGPSGDFVAFCGLWFESTNKYAYLEPLATDPDYRRMGLARAAAWEGIRRCAKLGATSVFVGSDHPFYLAIGFDRRFNSYGWMKRF